ncbi:MAG: hypothetical protein AAGD05_00600 [Bacteroidota bacterium]
MKLTHRQWLILGGLALFAFLLTCIRPIRALGFSNGWLPFLLDGTLQHKLGEVLLWIPFYYIGLSTFHQTQSDLLQRILSFRWSMLLGGILNLIAWWSLRHDVWWHLFCWVIFFWGLFAVPLCKRLFLPRAMDAPPPSV